MSEIDLATNQAMQPLSRDLERSAEELSTTAASVRRSQMSVPRTDPFIRILDRFATVTLSSEGLTTAIVPGSTISTDEASVRDMAVGFMVGVMVEVGVIGNEGWHRKGFLRSKWAT